jgi:hypothetical protein
MGQIFPLVYETSRIRAILGILKQNGGAIELSKLADETEEQVDDLLPLVEACKMLGFATIDESMIRITPQGKKVTLGNVLKLIKPKLGSIEPFMSTVKLLKNEKELSTEALFEKLGAQGISLHGDKAVNEVFMKKMLLRLGVRSKLLYYDTDRDIWSLGSERRSSK